MEASAKAVTLAALGVYAKRWNEHRSLRAFGVQIEFPDTTRLRLEVAQVSPDMRGGLGDDAVVNGGVLSALCDLAIGCTAGLIDPESSSATVQLSIRFEQPLRGERIVAEARVDRATRRMIFSSAEISDAAGRVSVRCQGIVTLLERPR
jgi:uncharacterized protein (TIGR00369 family)